MISTDGRNKLSGNLPAKKLKGFAMMDPERRREIASLGGKAAHAQGRAHKFTPEQARAAAIKGHETRYGRKV